MLMQDILNNLPICAGRCAAVLNFFMVAGN